VSSTIDLPRNICRGLRFGGLFGICDADDVAAAHIAGLELEETAGQRYIVCSRDQYSTLEVAEMVVNAAPELAETINLAAWREQFAGLISKKPSTDNQKLCRVLGVEDLIHVSNFCSLCLYNLFAAPSVCFSRSQIAASGGAIVTSRGSFFVLISHGPIV
jgi:hypothetical protein